MIRKSPTLSIIVPCYNEQATILEVLTTLRQELAVDHEIVVVNDGSVDDTPQLLANHPHLYDQLIHHPRNWGKGRALRTGFKFSTGQIVVVQDADLEYHPREITDLIQPILDGKADVVYGSRFVGNQPHRVVYFWHYVANWGLTILSDMVTNLNLTDMETGYKAISREFVDRLQLRETAFGIEPEITVRLAQLGARFYEIGISYHGRTYAEGKKIGFKDAMWAVWVLVRCGVFRR